MKPTIKTALLASALAFAAIPVATAANYDQKDAKAEAAYSGSVADVIAEQGELNTLTAAIEAAGLTATLADGGPFTIFAPTDAAFRALPEGELDRLLMEENKDELAAILKHHVISGKVKSGDLAGKIMTADTLNGALAIDATGDVMVGAGKVTEADLRADNGVIHVIDTVLIPSAD